MWSGKCTAGMAVGYSLYWKDGAGWLVVFSNGNEEGMFERTEGVSAVFFLKNIFFRVGRGSVVDFECLVAQRVNVSHALQSNRETCHTQVQQ